MNYPKRTVQMKAQNIKTTISNTNSAIQPSNRVLNYLQNTGNRRQITTAFNKAIFESILIMNALVQVLSLENRATHKIPEYKCVQQTDGRGGAYRKRVEPSKAWLFQ